MNPYADSRRSHHHPARSRSTHRNTPRLDTERHWHRLDWEHAAGLDTPFSGEAARLARTLATANSGDPDPAKALRELLERWKDGVVTSRRERRMAVRLSAEYAALPTIATDSAGDGPPRLELIRPDGGVVGDDDDVDEVDDAIVEADDFYADAFEVVQ